MTQNREFRGLTLDDFQEEAVSFIDQNKSVVVSAATGTGKTLIADYMIDQYLPEGKSIVYTAPIKALSNQKYTDFKALYGEENVGILTGDVSINQDAPLLIMTTEIYRNMLVSDDPAIQDIAYVIFDEVHYLGDIERGTVWEESIIFSADHIRFLCLSATIPNARQFANWIQHIKGHEVKVVTEKTRAVPLHHQFYEIQHGFVEVDELKKLVKLENAPKNYSSKKAKKKYHKKMKRVRKRTHVDLIRTLESQDNVPCIYFCFSRAKTQSKAEMLRKKMDLVTTQERGRIQNYVSKRLREADESVRQLTTTRQLKHCLIKGVGFHHAGLLPVHKEIVEHLFNEGLLYALFATETFAVGINMPAKAVCFDSLEKYDGISFRYLNSKEYFQLAGRAGRRGIDEVGYAISVLEANFADVDKVLEVTSEDRDPLKSQFKLSYNTVLNLLRQHDEEKRDRILRSSFYTYQQGGKKGSKRILASFRAKVKRLHKEGYLEEGTMGTELTNKGLFAMRIYYDELLFTELFCSDITSKLNHVEILIVIGTILHEERKNRNFRKEDTYVTEGLIPKLMKNRRTRKYFKENPPAKLETFLRKWYDGCDFVDLLDYTTMSEGDIVRFFRQIIDALQQIRHATLSEDLQDKVRFVEERIDRDVVAVTL